MNPAGSPAPAAAGVSLYDARPFFEKALQHGIQHGIIDAAKLAAMAEEAPKGMVQIARYFGNEFLRPDLEKARDRLVNLVSLQLEHTTGGDLQQAAEALQAHSLLSRSKAGSDLLKALLAMPQNSHFGMHDVDESPGKFSDDLIALLGKWSLRRLADYQAELARRQSAARVIDAAVWLAAQGGLDADDLQQAGADAEAVIRTALLMQATGRTRMPDWPAFEQMIMALRKAPAAGKKGLTLAALARPAGLPQPLVAVVDAARHSVLADLPKIRDAALPVRPLFNRNPAFVGRYFWLEDALGEVDEFDTQVSKAWDKVTSGQTDESALLTLFLCVAAGSAPKTLLTEKSATTLLRKIRKTGLHPTLARDYIRAHAPVQFEADYAQLWAGFVDEAQALLTSDAAFAMDDALALLRRECQVK